MLVKNKPVFVYDLEIFPNLFTCTAKNTESGNIKTFEISDRKNDLTALVKLFVCPNIMFCGYNNKHYDDPIMNYVLMNYEHLISLPVWEICRDLKEFSDKIISTKGKQYQSWSKYKFAGLFDSFDLLTMMFSDKLRVGLKAMQVTMGYKNVQEFDGDFEAPVTREEIDEVIKYNINDVESTGELLCRQEKAIRLREEIEKEYNISVLSKDGVNLGMEIIKTRYLEKTGKRWKEIKDLRSPVSEIPLKDVIFPYVSFKTKKMQDILDFLKNQVIKIDDTLSKEEKLKNKFEVKFEIGGLEHTYGLGGLHSVNKPEIFIGGDDYLIDSDVTSLYPSIILQNKLYPKHLGPEFLEVYQNIYDERVAAKREGRKTENETKKLALNGLTGNLQSQFSWVYDPVMVFKIRINGQLMLLMLIEDLTEAGFKPIQSNTDGVFFRVPKNREQDYLNICNKWSEVTHLNLEHDYFERFYQYAVNDYIGVKRGWSETHNPKLIKTKGTLSMEVEPGKGMAPVIIAEAVQKYFVEEIPVEKTLKDCNDITKFLTFQKVGKQFEVQYNGEPCRHINRYYVSMNGPKLQKVDKSSGKVIDLVADSGVTLFNVLQDIKPQDAHINYKWYRSQIYDFIDKMTFKQQTLF